MRERRRHLGDTEDEAEIHDHDEESGHQHAAPAAGGEPEIPARIVTRDNGAYAERPKRPDAGVAPKSPFLEIGRVRLAVDDAPSTFLFCHMPHSFSFAKPTVVKDARRSVPESSIAGVTPWHGALRASLVLPQGEFWRGGLPSVAGRPRRQSRRCEFRSSPPADPAAGHGVRPCSRHGRQASRAR